MLSVSTWSYNEGVGDPKYDMPIAGRSDVVVSTVAIVIGLLFAALSYMPSLLVMLSVGAPSAPSPSWPKEVKDMRRDWSCVSLALFGL